MYGFVWRLLFWRCFEAPSEHAQKFLTIMNIKKMMGGAHHFLDIGYGPSVACTVGCTWLMYSLCMVHIWPMYDLYMGYIWTIYVAIYGHITRIFYI